MSAIPGRTLPKTLGTFQLWGIAVGLVISGEYFGWSYGWASAGTLGFLVTTAFIALMYATFIFSFTELTTAIPRAGGPFECSRRAFGAGGGYLTANIVTLSVFGAIVRYILSMASLFRLRRSEPLLDRPFRAPAYPVFPAFAPAAAVVCLGTMVYFNPLLAGVFAGLAAIGYGYFLTTTSRRDAALARSPDSAAT